MATSQARCDRLLATCENANADVTICNAGLQFCRERSTFLIYETGRNPYDISKKCIGGYAGLCYPILDMAATYMQRPDVQQALGVEPGFEFKQCNNDIAGDFAAAGDVNRPSHQIVADLLDSGLKVLVFSGGLDWYCNAAGVRSVANALAWTGQTQFLAREEKPWLVEGAIAGSVKTFGLLSFAVVYNAGHMVPMDKPKEALALLNTWLDGTLN